MHPDHLDHLESAGQDALDHETWQRAGAQTSTGPACQWGDIDRSWHGRRVRVRWETGGSVPPDRRPIWLPGGVPHVLAGVVEWGPRSTIAALRVDGVLHVPPAHAWIYP